MDRLPFRTRARIRIFGETLAFFKGRIVPFCIAIVGLVVSYLYGHAHIAFDFLVRSIVMVACSYAIAFLGAVVVNALRVPWLLDAESGEQINSLEKRAQIAEASVQTLANQADQSEAIKKENKRLHDLFGELMDEGEALANELRRGMRDFGGWLQKRRGWAERVSTTLVEMNLPTEAAAFRHSGEKDARPTPGTVIDDKYLYQLYSEQLNGYRTRLQEIVTRRLP